MSLSRYALRLGCTIPPASRSFTSSVARYYAEKEKPKNVFPNDRKHYNAEDFAKTQIDRPLNPHMTNTTSTISNQMPSVGVANAPPELLSAVEDFKPKDSVPENTERMTGGTQKGEPDSGTNAELGVGEMDGVDFKVEPKRRSGEDANTLRARLVYQSRKRGTLESDLLLSTFADANLDKMTVDQLRTYDHFLDENDWDIYYWATQQPTPTSHETAEGGNPEYATPAAQDHQTSGDDADKSSSMTPSVSNPNGLHLETDAWRQGKPRSGEWAQTVGTVKQKYRPVPVRWRNSEILAMLRMHVIDRSAAGVQGTINVGVMGEGLAQSVKGVGGGGLGRMPEVKNFDV